MKHWTSTLALTLLTACAVKPPKAPTPSDLLYPHGTYQQKVKVHIVKPYRNFELRGVLQSSPEVLKVVGLSTFNTTVFRINENLKTGDINKEFYVDAIRHNEDKFMFFYRLLKELVLAPKNQTEFEKQGARFKVGEPDENNIYRKIEITHEQFRLNIEVTGYEF